MTLLKPVVIIEICYRCVHRGGRNSIEMIELWAPCKFYLGKIILPQAICIL